ncbi:MAG: SlyX family protein [Betaproteobacteria bacterium]|nr:SlyX family protein [Betaproteobacteria bacterium]
MDDRLEKLEGKLTLAEDQLDELNKTVHRQQQQIERLQREMLKLREQLPAALPNEPRSLKDEIPPHY